MEPLDPELRAALKEAHPGLTDEDIDRSEALLDERMNTDPSVDPGRIEELERERAELIRRTMPRYTEVARVVNARGRASTRPSDEERIRVTPKRHPEEPSA